AALQRTAALPRNCDEADLGDVAQAGEAGAVERLGVVLAEISRIGHGRDRVVASRERLARRTNDAARQQIGERLGPEPDRLAPGGCRLVGDTDIVGGAFRAAVL